MTPRNRVLSAACLLAGTSYIACGEGSPTRNGIEDEGIGKTLSALTSASGASETTPQPTRVLGSGKVRLRDLPPAGAEVSSQGGPVHAPAPVPAEVEEAGARRVRRAPVSAAEQAPLTPAAPAVPSPAPSTSFPAIADDGLVFPPDTEGSVGPDHLLISVNRRVRIQDKTGTNLNTVSLLTFFQPASAGLVNLFDPRSEFDPLSDRFIVVSAAEPDSANSSLMIAVSDSNDAEGTWNTFRLDADAADQRWLDFPNVGFNRDWIVVTGNMIPITGGTAVGTRLHVFICNKADLIAGTGTCTTTDLAHPGTSVTPATTLDGTLATLYLGRVGSGNADGSNGQILIGTVTGPVNTPTIALDATTVLLPGIWANFQPSGNFGPQRDHANGLELEGAKLANLIFRDGSLWGAHTIYLPQASPTRSSIQWFEIDPDGTREQSGRVDDSTGARFFAYPSIAVNANHDVLIGYSRFAEDQFVSANYSFRAGTDAPNTLRDDLVFKEGEATNSEEFPAGRFRWGDYSGTQVDPSNDLDLWTIQEYAESPADNWGTWWARIGNRAPVAKCRNVVKPADAACRASVAVSEVDDGSFDPDGDPFTCSLNPPGPFSLGPTAVTLTCTDTPGASASCSAQVTVVDTTPPTFSSVPPAVTISTCVNASIGQATATDNCGPVTVTSNKPAKFPLGTTTVTWTATDGAGLTATATQQVTAVLGDDPSCCPNGTNVIVGNNSANRITGTNGSDCIIARGGDDTIDARGGNDFISGGSGRDTIAAGAGNDLVMCGAGDDVVNGGPGNDVIRGEGGRDTITGGDGDDLIDGGPEVDICFAPPGADQVLACEV
jgi:RTX calcium-binding nonapeptide repeat (4 copies)/HYR domain